MATNLFGNPVTNDTVRLVYPNLTASSITARHRADVAILYMHQENRMENLSRFVYNLIPSNYELASTLGMLYNATGNNLTFFSRRTWEGDVSQVFYPTVIQNGQWAGFVHLDTRGGGRQSKEAIVYRGQDETGGTRYWILAWTTRYLGVPPPNRVYTTIEGSPPSTTSYWDRIEGMMNRVDDNFHTMSLNRCFSSVTIGQGGRVELVGIMTLTGVITPVIVYPWLEDADAGDADADADAAE